MKVRIKVNYVPTNVLYLSDIIELTETELSALQTKFRDIKNMDYLKLTLNGCEQYVSPYVLCESVIVIEKIEE